MKRYTGQKALYEVIAKTQAKYRRRGILERLRPGNSGQEARSPAAEEPKPQQVEPLRPAVEKLPEPIVKPVRPMEHSEPPLRPVQPRLRPKAVQLHDGRIEVSLPYTIGVTVLLVAIVVVLGAFRLGQRQHRYRLPTANSSISEKAKPPALNMDASPARAEAPTPAPAKEAAVPDTGATAAPAAEGDHVIVLAQYARQEDLVPVKEYFRQHNINTEILAVDKLRDYLAQQGINTGVLGNRGGYMLVAPYYNNPENPGTDGYAVKQKIKELGRGYKAPSGMESFAPKYFSDAYGMKVR
jgi:hypothetical protein